MVQIPKHTLVRWLLTALIFIGFGLTFFPFFTPLLMAALFAFALEPFVARFSKSKKTKRKVPTALVLTGLFMLILLPLFIVISRLIAKSKELTQAGLNSHPAVASAEKLIASISTRLSEISSQLGFGNISEESAGLAAKAAGWVLEMTTAMIAQLPQIVLGIFIFSCALYYFLTQARSLKKTILAFDLLDSDQLNSIIAVVQKSSYITLVMAGIIGSTQALTVSIFAWFAGYNEFFLVFLLTFFMSLIPVIGAAPMAILISILSFSQGESGSGVTMLVAGAIAGSIDNVLKPLMLSSQEDDTHPVVTLIALIGAVIIYGFPGLLLGPVLTQLTFRIIPILFVAKEVPAQSGE